MTNSHTEYTSDTIPYLEHGLPSRVDETRLEDALDTARFIADHHDADGNYDVEEHWGPEGELYRAICTWAMMDAYRISGDEKFLKKTRAVLDRFERRQREEGGWSLSLGEDGLEFTISEAERQDTRIQGDPPISGAVLKSIAEYQSLTDSDEYTPMGERAFDHLMELWSPELGSVHEDRDRHLAGLRSNPDSYHFFFLLGFSAWKPYAPGRISRILPKTVEFVRKTFEEFDEETMPLMYANHAVALMDHYSLKYVENHIRPRLDRLTTESDFRSKTVPGGYGHHDGARGIVTDELHMRSSGGLALAMKSYDLNTNSRYYRDSDVYAEVADWIDSMKVDEGGYYEYQTTANRERRGRGASGQYIPCFWIFGKI